MSVSPQIYKVFTKMIPSFCFSFLSSYSSSAVSFDSCLWKFIIIISQSIYFYYDIEYRCWSETEENLSKKPNGDRTPRRSALSAAVLGRHHGLQREQKQISTIRINLHLWIFASIFKENIPNLCPMAQTSRAEVAQCKV